MHLKLWDETQFKSTNGLFYWFENWNRILQFTICGLRHRQSRFLPACVRRCPGASFQLFLGGQIFLNLSMPPDYWKIGKNSTYVVNLTLFIVPFFLSFSFFSLFSFFLSFFLFFHFCLGNGPQPPSKDAPGVARSHEPAKTALCRYRQGKL